MSFIKPTMVLGFLIMMSRFPAPGQLVDKNYYSNLVVKKSETLTVLIDSLYVDTLMMHDNSTLLFPQPTLVIVEHAFIGNKASFDASGEKGNSGKRGEQRNQSTMHGEAGSHGRSLQIVIIFERLGTLTINTSGGKGGDGANGRRGGSGMSGALGGNDGERGEMGGNGGNGGHGGNVHLHYAGNGFFPLINPGKERNNGITIIIAGGKGGRSGRPGSGGWGGSAYQWGSSTPTGARGKDGSYGQPGIGGIDGKDGELVLKRIIN
jgi:hypothetical protein